MCHNLRHFETRLRTDHLPIAIDIVVNSSQHVKPRLVFEDRLTSGTELKHINKILNSPSWPSTPFIEVAKQYQRTKQSKIKRGEFYFNQREAQRANVIVDRL